jgi:hypothetical protein
MNVLAWYINPNDIKIQNTIKYPYHVDIQTCENLIIDTHMV